VNYVIVENERGYYIDGYPCRNLINGVLMAQQLNGGAEWVEVYHLDGCMNLYRTDGFVVERLTEVRYERRRA